MKIIDLLNKIANGEEVPKKFTYKGYLWEYDVKNKMWFYYFGESKCHRFDRLFYLNMILNDEVKILEEENKIPEKEAELIRYNIQDFDNLKEFVEITTNNVFGKINEIINKQNKIIDYLKNKGDE